MASLTSSALRRARSAASLWVLLCAAMVPAARADEAATEEEAPIELDLPAFTATGDLGQVRKKGVLRVLVEAREPAFLARAGSAEDRERELAREFARREELKVQFVRVATFDGLIPALLAGAGDVVAAGLTVTEAREQLVAFTRPVATVSEVLVGRKGGDVPKDVAALAGREVHVGAGTAYVETLEALRAERGVAAKVVAVRGPMDPEQLAWDVSSGTRPLTVLDSDMYAAIAAYNDRLERGATLAEGRQIAWAVRKQNGELKARLDAYLLERALTAHAEERATGDLPELKKRGSLRVLTRNNPVTYFLHRGERLGFDYEMARAAADQAGLRLEMVVVPSWDQLVPWLLEGRGDVIAASFSDTPERRAQVAFSEPYLRVDEVIVQRRTKGAPRAKGLDDLKGRTVAARASSAYWQTLAPLAERHGFKLVALDEDLETEEALDELAHGRYDFAVADSHILAAERTWRSDVEQAFVLPAAAGAAGPGGARPIAFAVRPQNVELKAFLDGFVRKHYRGVAYNMARKRYFENKQTARIGHTESSAPGRLSPYDDIIRRHAKRYGLDWRLMAAQAYQESRFDPRAKSWVGAKGLFQVMPATGRAMGYEDLENPEVGTHAGIEYLHGLIDQLDERIPFKHRVRFALAAYNVGLGHVLDAQRLAQAEGLDPRKWFGHVEKAMLLLEKPRYHAKARHGYCRGSEPVKYVSEIQNRYDNYVKVIPE